MIKPSTSTQRLWGRDLPASYSLIDNEFNLLTGSRGLLDFSHLEWVRVVGSDATAFLQGLLSQDINAIGPGTSAGAWLLDRNGKILADLQIYRNQTHEFLIGVAPAESKRVLELLDHYLIMEDVVLSIAAEITCLSIQGPTAGDVSHFGKGVPFSVDRCGRGGWDLLLSKDDVPECCKHYLDMGIHPCGFSALNLARVQGFIPWFGIDMKLGVNPMIYGQAGRISNTKGCFVGQETVARTRDRGHPPHLLVQLQCAGGPILEKGAALTCEGKAAGEITSFAQPPGSEVTWALATLKYACAESSAELLDANGTTWLRHRLADKPS